MEENENKKFHRSKRPKIKVKENINNKDYISMTEENNDSDNRRNFKSNMDFKTNEANEEEESKRLGQNKRSLKKSLNEFKKKMKNLILKISSPSHRLKYLFKKWAYITFNQKNKNMDEDEEEEEEEIEKEENVRDNVEVFKMKKVKRFQDDNDDKKDNLDGEEEEEEEEEEEDKFNLMNDLNMNNLEEIEERPPNEEESAMTSVVSKAKYPKNQLNVALRKIIKYKNKSYVYFTKWKIITSMIILKLQKKLKTLITKLNGKRNLLKLAMAFKDWKMKTEQLKSGEKKNKKKKRIIIYKKKNGEMEIKENIEDCKDLNLKDDDDLSIKKDGTKIKKIKKKIIKKKITTSKAKSSKKPSSNNNNEKINNTTINFTPIKDDNYISQDNLININKKESEKSETNISNTTSDIKADINKNENEESGIKPKKIVKKVKKIVKKVKKVKKDNDASDNEEKSKGNERKHYHINKADSVDLPQMFVSSDQLKIVKPLYLAEKNIENGNEKDVLNGISYTKKTRIKLKTKKISRDDINNKSFDMLLEKGNDFKINNLTNALFQSYNLNTDLIDDDKSKDKSFSIEDKDGTKKKKIIKKKIRKSKIKDLKDKKENNNENNDNKDLNNINNDNFQDIKSIQFTPIKSADKNEDKSNNDDSSQKKFITPSKVQFKTDDEDSQKKKEPDFYHNYGKDSHLDLRAIDSLDLVDFSEDTSEDDAKKVKKKKKTNKIKKNGDNISKDEINPDIANIEITQDDDSDEKKKFNKKKKKKNGREYTKEEKAQIKSYKRAFHLLRKAIRSYKKRKKTKNEFNDNIVLDKHFTKWKNIFMNKDKENNKDRNEENKNDRIELSDKKLGEEIIKNNIDIADDNKGENTSRS